MFIHLIYNENCVYFLVELFDEIPLNPTKSDSNELSHSHLDYDIAVDEAERRLLDIKQHPTIDTRQLRTSPEQKSPFNNVHKNGKRLSLTLDAQQDQRHSISNLRDINAMSIASIYDREHNEIMDADK